MGAWGITVRQSDDGLDLLDTIVAEQLRKVDFAAFNVSEAITLLNQTIQEEIEQYKQKPPSKATDFYISETLMHDFTNAALLIAECPYDYYQTGEFVVYDYVGENYDPVEYHIKNFVVTGNDLLPLLAELESVQSPEHWKYQTEEGHYYDCCSNIETLVTDEYHEAPYWIRTNVAHNGEDYYLVGYKGLSMDGLHIRVRSAA